MRLNLGCGTDVMTGYVNIDSAPLRGVDIVHDLSVLPWPLDAGSAEEIQLINVLEHLDDVVGTVEEMHRVLDCGGVAHVRVPFYNSPDMFADPTHRSFFSERTFDFFDPGHPACRSRPYYSTARFDVNVETVYVKVLRFYVPLRKAVPQRIALWFARRLGGIVWVLQFRLLRLDPAHG